MDNQICPCCGSVMKRDIQPLTLQYKDGSSTFDMPGWYCSNCEEAVYTGKDMQESDRQLNLLKARAESVLLPEDVRRIRKKLGLTQNAAGNLLGGGENAFHKYERGDILPSQAISNLLRVLEAHPQTLKVLQTTE
jgi:HTH-type transcriptional regulator/antitoxin MqsA